MEDFEKKTKHFPEKMKHFIQPNQKKKYFRRNFATFVWKKKYLFCDISTLKKKKFNIFVWMKKNEYFVIFPEKRKHFFRVKNGRNV